MTIYGAPRTKKTSNRILQFGKFKKIVPSEQYIRWQASAVPQMRVAWAGRVAVNYPVNVRAVFYRDANRGDLIGYMQALADALQTARVLEDDRFVVSWDGTRMRVDRKRPRVEIEIDPAPGKQTEIALVEHSEDEDE
jgi:Holliday junction resolvase RusA-like endonuclease